MTAALTLDQIEEAEERHTPGPWRAVKTSYGPVDVFDPRGRDVVTVYGGGVEHESQFANARLIAAAPDMLAALKDILIANADGKDVGKYLDAVDVARAAIAKAEGPTPPRAIGGRNREAGQ